MTSSWSDSGRNLESFQVYVTHLFNFETYIYNKNSGDHLGSTRSVQPLAQCTKICWNILGKKHRPTCFDHLHPSLTLCIPICLHPVPCAPLTFWKLNTKSNGTVTFYHLLNFMLNDFVRNSRSKNLPIFVERIISHLPSCPPKKSEIWPIHKFHQFPHRLTPA